MHRIFIHLALMISLVFSPVINAVSLTIMNDYSAYTDESPIAPTSNHLNQDSHHTQGNHLSFNQVKSSKHQLAPYVSSHKDMMQIEKAGAHSDHEFCCSDCDSECSQGCMACVSLIFSFNLPHQFNQEIAFIDYPYISNIFSSPDRPPQLQ